MPKFFYSFLFFLTVSSFQINGQIISIDTLNKVILLGDYYDAKEKNGIDVAQRDSFLRSIQNTDIHLKILVMDVKSPRNSTANFIAGLCREIMLLKNDLVIVENVDLINVIRFTECLFDPNFGPPFDTYSPENLKSGKSEDVRKCSFANLFNEINSAESQIRSYAAMLKDQTVFKDGLMRIRHCKKNLYKKLKDLGVSYKSSILDSSCRLFFEESVDEHLVLDKLFSKFTRDYRRTMPDGEWEGVYYKMKFLIKTTEFEDSNRSIIHDYVSEIGRIIIELNIFTKAIEAISEGCEVIVCTDNTHIKGLRCLFIENKLLDHSSTSGLTNKEGIDPEEIESILKFVTSKNKCCTLL